MPITQLMMVAMENEIMKELWETLVVIGRSVFEDNIILILKIKGWCVIGASLSEPHTSEFDADSICVCVGLSHILVLVLIISI